MRPGGAAPSGRQHRTWTGRAMFFQGARSSSTRSASRAGRVCRRAPGRRGGLRRSGAISCRRTAMLTLVAEDVALVDDDVAEIDAYAEGDAAVVGHRRAARDHLDLDLDDAAHGIDDAGELDQHSVARRRRRGHLRPPCWAMRRSTTPIHRAFSAACVPALVASHQPGIAGDTSGIYDGGQAGDVLEPRRGSPGCLDGS